MEHNTIKAQTIKDLTKYSYIKNKKVKGITKEIIHICIGVDVNGKPINCTIDLQKLFNSYKNPTEWAAKTIEANKSKETYAEKCRN